jgi:hypothetical protein
MDSMIERWPLEWTMRFPTSEYKMLKELESLSAEEIEAHLRQRAIVAGDATNAQRLRHARALIMLNEEMAKSAMRPDGAVELREQSTKR